MIATTSRTPQENVIYTSDEVLLFDMNNRGKPYKWADSETRQPVIISSTTNPAPREIQESRV